MNFLMMYPSKGTHGSVAKKEIKEKTMTGLLLLGWVVLIIVSYKAAVAVLVKTNNL